MYLMLWTNSIIITHCMAEVTIIVKREKSEKSEAAVQQQMTSLL